MKLKITTLIEDTVATPNLISEHGLSFFVEQENQGLLFDCGQSDAFLQNAAKLNIPLAKTKEIILSHSHYDHTGGLIAFGNQYPGCKLHIHHDFLFPKYHQTKTQNRYIGNPFDIKKLMNTFTQIHFISGKTYQINEKFYLLSQAPLQKEFETITDDFKILEKDLYQQDHFQDEISLIVRTSLGLIIILGCSHRGMINILEFSREYFQEKIFAVLGGSHLNNASEKRLEKTLSALIGMNIPHLGLCHCTGTVAQKLFQKNLPGYFTNQTGTQIKIDDQAPQPFTIIQPTT